MKLRADATREDLLAEYEAAQRALDQAGAPDKEAIPDYPAGEGHWYAARLSLVQRIHMLARERDALRAQIVMAQQAHSLKDAYDVIRRD